MKQSLAVKTFEDLFAELGERARTRPPAAAPSPRWTAVCTRWARRSSKRPVRCGWPPSTRSDDALAEEISQLLYWTQVLMIARGLTLDDVYRKL